MGEGLFIARIFVVLGWGLTVFGASIFGRKYFRGWDYYQNFNRHSNLNCIFAGSTLRSKILRNGKLQKIITMQI